MCQPNLEYFIECSFGEKSIPDRHPALTFDSDSADVVEWAPNGAAGFDAVINVDDADGDVNWDDDLAAQDVLWISALI